MSESPIENPRPPASSDAVADQLPADLPPIEPPSAGFIMQLFVVPAFIVAIIIGLWLLFGKMVSEDQDIHRVLIEIKSSNTLRRGPAMHQFAQLLQIDSGKPIAEQQYVNNSQVASESARLLTFWIDNIPPDTQQKSEVLDAQVFLTRALAWFETTPEILSVLQRAMNIPVEPAGSIQETQLIHNMQQAVRESAMASLAHIAGRELDRNKPLNNQEISEDLIGIALDSDEEARVRRVATFCLGLFPSERAQEKLKLILITADSMTRLNAAVGLARQHSTEGYVIFHEILENALKPYQPELSFKEPTPQELKKATNQYNYEQRLKLKNTLNAIADLSSQWNEQQMNAITNYLEPIAEKHEIFELRALAEETLNELKKTLAES